MADNKFVTLEALKSTAARLQQEWLKSISKAGHARFEVAEAIGCNVAADGCLLLWRSQLDHEFTSNFCLLSGIGFSVPVSGGA